MPGKRRIRAYTYLLPVVLVAAGAVGACVIVKWREEPSPAENATANGPKAILAEANHFAFLSNSYRAEPLYAKAEQMFSERGDRRDELYAKIGRLRAEAETMSFAKLSAFIGSQLARPLVQHDPELKLWCLTAKGMTDIEVNVPAAKADWQEAEALARRLKESQWEARAKGELGLIAFLQGNSLKAGQLVGAALLSAMSSGDRGAEVRYLELIGNGLEVQGRSEEAEYFFNRAIRIVKSCQDCGFPYMAYEGKGEALAALGKFDDARAALTECLNRARHEQRSGHAAQTLILLGKLSLKTGQTAGGIDELEEAAGIAGKFNYYQLEEDDLFELAGIYKQQGELTKAARRLRAACDLSMKLGDRSSLPRNLTALAHLEMRLGKVQEAERLYDQAEDVVDAIVMNAPGPYSGGSFVGEASATYLGDFELAVQTNNLHRAFRALERARGRTIEDALESRASSKQLPTPAYRQAESAISTVQLKLMRSESPEERQRLLVDLEEQEQRLAYLNDVAMPRTPMRLWQPPALRVVQSSLTPDEMILEYVLDEPRSFCLWITHDKEGITRLNTGRGGIEDFVARYLASVRALRTASSLTKKLYSVLIAPIPASGKTHFIIVPDGKLYLLPFDALENSAGQPLVKTVDVTYVPSASVREILLTRKSKRPPTRAFLGVGDVAYEPINSHTLVGRLVRGLYDLAGVKQLRNLPGSRQEVMDADRALGGSGSVMLLGPQATLSAFESDLLNILVFCILQFTRSPARNFQPEPHWCWAEVQDRIRAGSFRSGRSSICP
jgi:tetratricopeptide (TPR) repeat protein